MLNVWRSRRDVSSIIGSFVSEADAPAAPYDGQDPEGAGAMWGEEGVGGVTREQALAREARRPQLHVYTNQRVRRADERETPQATAARADGASRMTSAERVQIWQTNAARVVALVLYAALISFFLVILLGDKQKGSPLHVASLAIVCGIMGLWLVVVILRCIFVGRRPPESTRGLNRTPISLQEFLAMNNPLTPPRTGVDPKVRESFRYFRYSDPSLGDIAAAAAAANAAEGSAGNAEKGVRSVDGNANANDNANDGVCAVIADESSLVDIEIGEGGNTADQAGIAAEAAPTAAEAEGKGCVNGTASAEEVSSTGQLQTASEGQAPLPDAPWAAEVTCSICLEDFVEGHELCALPCAHTFHSSCLGVWLSTHADCPLCKVNLHAVTPSNAAAAAAPGEQAPAHGGGLPHVDAEQEEQDASREEEE